MANCLLLYTPSSRMNSFFAVLFCCVTCSASSGLIASAPMAMNVTLGSEVSISCSSADTSAIITLAVSGLSLSPTSVVMNGVKTTSALFNATANLNGTMMDCSVISGSELETSSAVLLLIQGPPSAPSNIASQPIDPCSMKITWVPPVTLVGVPLYFNVTVTTTKTQEIVDYASTEDKEIIFSPSDLTGTYTVRIIAWNAVGSSVEVSQVVAFTMEGFVAMSNGSGRDGVTWILNFTALNTCMSEAVANATIKLCSESGGQQCDIFSAPKENIEQFVDGELHLSFPVHVQDQRTYNSTLYVHYERGQELFSINSVLIDTSDIRDVDVSLSDPNGIACFIVKQVPGSLLYGMVVQFVDRSSGNSITRVAVVNDDKSVCIEDLPPGDYSISVGDLEAPLLSIDEGVTIAAESPTIITATSTVTNQEDQGALVAGVVVSIIMVIFLLILIVVTLLIWLMYRHSKAERIKVLISNHCRDDNNGCDDCARGEGRRVESDAVQAKSFVLTEKVNMPIQVSERERSPHTYKPSV